MSFTIRNLTKKDIRTVADLHSSVFMDSRTTCLGKRYLRKMYRWFLEEQPCLSLVAEQDGRIIGFIVGAIGGYGRRMFRYTFLEIILAFVLHPSLLFRKEMFKLWQSYLQAFNPFLRRKVLRANIQPPVMNKASLASIGVSRSAQGAGVGKKLMTAFEDHARAQGASFTGLSVRAENRTARKLYESCGWEYVEQYSTADSAYYMKQLLIRNN